MKWEPTALKIGLTIERTGRIYLVGNTRKMHILVGRFYPLSYHHDKRLRSLRRRSITK